MVYAVVGALVIGITLGLLGSGGSILTVPVLIYLLGHDNKVAIAESLAIVGLIALAAAIPYARSRLVDWRSVIYFGLPGMVGTYLGAWMAEYVSGELQLTLFALVMLLAAYMMFRRAASEPGVTKQAASRHQPTWQIALEGLVVGIITGLVGVGGGFLIVPALVVLGGLPMHVAIGTSLAVIALKSATGFIKYLDVLERVGASIDWSTVIAFAGVGIVGSLIGKLVGSRVDHGALRRGFAVFLIVMGVFVLAKEAPQVFAQQPSTPRVEVASRTGEGGLHNRGTTRFRPRGVVAVHVAPDQEL